MDKQGDRPVPRLPALAMLLACTSLLAPATAIAQVLYPAASGTTGIGSQPTAASSSAPLFGEPGALPAYGVDLGSAPSRASGTPPDGTGSAADRETLATGSIPASATVEPPYEEDLTLPSEQELDVGADAIEPGEAPLVRSDPTGIRLGTFMLRPSVSNSVNRERIRNGDTKTERDYLATAIRGTLTSDWSRHELTVNGEGTFERDIGGRDDIQPEGRVDANLRLDLADETLANISAGYGFEREDNNDPNAIGGASVQSGVHQLDGGLTLERNAGLVHGLAGIDVGREIYTDAELQDGSSLDLSDRNRTTVDGRLRLGYELSRTLIPFVEVVGGRSRYDDRYDSAGYQRSSWRYAGRAGVEFDLGEKLRGELAAGYERADYDDARLEDLGGVTFDSRAVWSPQRGTDVELALRTTLQDATAPGASGWTEYDATAVVTHQLRHRLIGRLTGGATLRDFPESESETTWLAGAGLVWSVNPYLDLNGDLEYERTLRTGDDTNTWRAGMGLTLRR